MNNINQKQSYVDRSLPTDYQRIYRIIYKDYASSKGLLRTFTHFIESWYHKKVGKVFVKDNQSILEIGCGSLNHIKYENHYSSYDVVEPQHYLLENSNPGDLAVINNSYPNLNAIPCTYKYDKIISIACLEHILTLEDHLSHIKMRLSEGGKFVAAIPAEGEFLWWLSWRLSTGFAFWLKYKLDYGVIMRYEHINNAKKITDLLYTSFHDVKSCSYPIVFRHCRIYIFFECSNPIFGPS